SDRVAEAQTPRARLDRGEEEPAQILRFAARRILRHVRDGQVLARGESDRFDGLLLDEREVPLLRVLTDRRRTDESVQLDGPTGLLLHLGGRRDVADHGTA